MVGLVLVSHSRPLAEAAIDMIRRTVGRNLPIVCSGGVGDRREELGTDAVEIQVAITKVYSEEGVLVLMDVGSAVLSAELAKDMLKPEMQQKVLLSSAPLAEGGISAAFQALSGASISDVAKAARESLLPKQDQLQDNVPAEERTASAAIPPRHEILDVTIENEYGLHLRPAATLIKTLAGYPGEVLIENRSGGRGPVTAKSLVDVTRLQIQQGDSVRFLISSSDPQPLAEAIRSMVATQFGECSQQAAISSEPAQSGAFGVSKGVAIGRPVFLTPIRPEIPTHTIKTDYDVTSEISRLHSALRASAEEFNARVRRLQTNLRPEDINIFEAQRMILEDPSILREVEQKIRKTRLNSAAAWHEVFARHAAEQEGADDPYFRTRAADLREVERIGLVHLVETKGFTVPEKSFADAAIMVCDELTPALADEFYRLSVSGVIQLYGGTTSHGAILARALNLPAIGGAERYLEAIRSAGMVAINGSEGGLWVDPSPDLLAKLKEAEQLEHAQLEEVFEQSERPAFTRDGIHVLVAANAGSAQEIANAQKYGAESIGLLRSEFLFRHFNHEPDEQEQLNAYRGALGTENVLPINVRLLDVGGDKPVKFLWSQKEANPFLGVRGVRLLFANPGFFRAHLRALLRLAGPMAIRLLVPMVTDAFEIINLKRLLDKAAQSLKAEHIAHRWPVPLGVMIETPSAALLIDQILPSVDFVSIGTNDLTQYVLCAERGSLALSAFADSLHPSVVRICHEVIQKCRQSGIEVSVCGEVASDADAIPILLGLGLREFSVAPPAILRTKALIRRLDFGRITTRLAPKILSFSSALDVREFSRVLAHENKESATQ